MNPHARKKLPVRRPRALPLATAALYPEWETPGADPGARKRP